MHLVSPRAPAKKSWLRPLGLGGAAGVALLLTGCASRPDAVAAKAAPGERVVLTADQYEYVYVTGTTLPVRVPKEPISRPASQTAFPVVIASPEAFERMMQRAQGGGR